MSALYRTGLVGFGLAGSSFHAPVLSASKRFRLCAVVSSRREDVLAVYPDVEVYSSPDEMLAHADIEVVVIASPNTSHFQIAEMSLKAGKHVVIDKPWVINSEDGRHLMHTAARHDCRLSVYHNRRWDNDFLTLKELIAEQKLGDIREFHSHFDRFRPQIRDRWRERNIPGSGILFDLGPHLIDQALVLFGKPLSVFADVAATRSGGEIEDYFHILLEYPWVKVHLHSGCFVADPQPIRFRVFGSRGSWTVRGVDPQEAALRSGRVPGRADVVWGTDVDDRSSIYYPVLEDGSIGQAEHIGHVPGDYSRFYHQFADAIDGTADVPVDPVDALLGLEILEAALKSSIESSRIFFPV
ncbi:oxidoreductase [Spirochaeta dissipatitropha]